MAPTLAEGSIIAVHLEDRSPHHDSLFLLKWENEIMARRIQIQNGHLLFCPDNPDKEKYSIAVCPIKRVNADKNSPLLGRIVWSMELL